MPIQRKTYLDQITRNFRSHPVVGILGPRQCGKTTLARDYIQSLGAKKTVHYFDLEDPDHLNRLSEPKLALADLQGLIVIDEIQRLADLFPLLRVLVDRKPRKQRYLILGSASQQLIRQSSETLAGRIVYLNLPPFTAFETENMRRLWLRGGFPPSFLARSNATSETWRKAYITSYLERDLPAMGIDFNANTMRKFWMMLAHWHGNIFNASEFARSLDVSSPTVKRYLDILAGTFVVRSLQPWYANIHKRQIKSPKVYISDSGLLHTLLGISDQKGLQTHPKIGASWEGFALEQTIQTYQADNTECFFWGTHTEAELDLLINKGGKRLAFEFKYSSAPKITRSMHTAIRELELDRLTIVYPGQDSYRLSDNVQIVGLEKLNY